eukprot:11413830-Karenia_brevis.AAC.1
MDATMECAGAVYFAAGEDAAREEHRRICQARHMNADYRDFKEPWISIMTSCQKQRHADYSRVFYDFQIHNKHIKAYTGRRLWRQGGRGWKLRRGPWKFGIAWCPSLALHPPCYVCCSDLNQNEGQSSKPGILIPTLLTHGLIYGWDQKRYAVGDEDTSDDVCDNVFQ